MSSELHLLNHQLRDVFLGKELRGRPSRPSCYTDDNADYEKITSKFFLKVIAEIESLHDDFSAFWR